MQYFSTLPKIVKTDANRNSVILTDLMARCSIIPKILKNPMVYYDYDIQDGDTPEIVAYKYYGQSYRYWIVLFANQINDPQWDWPLSTNNFNAYIKNKYQNFNPYATVHHYEKIITQYDSATQTTTTKKIIIDQSTYNLLNDSTNTYTLVTGPVTVTITKTAISYYDYELNLNESKRSIRILNSIYVNQFEQEFKALMTV
jgi:hypothetical protein